MGCEDIEDQIMIVKSAMHVYGHSTMRAIEEHGKVLFVNHYHGYIGTEGTQEGSNRPLCIFDAQHGIVVEDTRQRGRAESDL